MKERTKKEIRVWLVLLTMQIAWIAPCALDSMPQEPIEDEWIEEYEDVLRFEMEKVEVELEEKETVMVQQASADGIRYYDVPLSEELQLHLFQECDGRNIAPAIILAMIDRESDYDSNKIGDNGESFGLMQIQPRWHYETMEELGCDNLLDPYQNISVGVKIIADLIEKDSDVYWVLMSYNGGESYANRRIKNGNISEYALEVVERAGELENQYAAN